METTKTTTSSIKSRKAQKAVEKIMAELSTRKGFNDLFDLIDASTMTELMRTLSKIVEENI